MIKLSKSEQDKALSFMLDLCIRANIVPNTRAAGYDAEEHSLLHGTETGAGRFYKRAADNITNVITKRTFDFMQVFDDLEGIVKRNTVFGTSKEATLPTWKPTSSDTLAQYLAWVCQEGGIYWDDIKYSPEERTAMIDEEGAFAKALNDAEVFASQPGKAVGASGTPSAAPAPKAAPAAGGAPKSGYKSAGPQSAFVKGLVGTPGEKLAAPSWRLFCIVADKTRATYPNAFIHPVENPDAGERAALNSAGLPIVKFGTGNAYTDLTIYSDDRAKMDEILSKISARGITSKYDNVHVAAVSSKPGNVYYKVNTEFGEVYVRATKLNEKLFKEAEAPKEEVLTESPEVPEKRELTDEEIFSVYEEYDPSAIVDIKEFAHNVRAYD